jgi:hypothetical protein
MALTIKARIPADNGKTLQFGAGPGGTFVVATEKCEGYNCLCTNDATVIVKGETDSFGWEPVYYCDDCLAKSDGEASSYEAALDVEDRAGFFYISEGTNYDGYGDWDATFTSYRAAVVYLRRIEDRAAQYGGLYPNNGVQETDAEGLEKVKARFARARRELEEELYGAADEDDAEAEFEQLIEDNCFDNDWERSEHDLFPDDAEV